MTEESNFNPRALYAERIGGEKFGTDDTVYKFEKIKRARVGFEKAEAAKAAKDSSYTPVKVLNVGVGEHDGMPAEIVRDALAPCNFQRILNEMGYLEGQPIEMTPEFIAEVEAKLLEGEVHSPANKGYPDNGILEFQQASAQYVNNLLGTSIPTGGDAAQHVLHRFGSKTLLSLLATPFINPGDATVMTTPGYGVAGTNTKYMGGQVLNLPLTAANGFLPDLNDLENTVALFNRDPNGSKVKMVVLNYPNNPTGADAPQEFWDEVAGIANHHNCMVVQDMAYPWNYTGKQPASILSAKGGDQCGAAIFSLSKAFNMIGYRGAQIVSANPDLIAPLAEVKDNQDSGQWAAIQRAGIVAMENPWITDQIAEKYQRRLEGMVGVLNKFGFDAEMPDGTFFLYTPSPTGAAGEKFKTAEDASQYFLKNQGVSVVPWDDVGNFLRFSATFSAGDPFLLKGDPKADEEVLAELDSRLEKAEFVFN